MWIILEGLDRSGKTTVAQKYASDGFKVIHMSAPDSKYFVEGYSGPSYAEEMVELYTQHIGQNVVWDRSVYGELIWPFVYNRPALLELEDMDMLRELEESEQTQYVLMCDPDMEAHWARCKDNQEPLTRAQFAKANNLYNSKLVKELKFVKNVLDESLITKPDQTPEERSDPQETPEKVAEKPAEPTRERSEAGQETTPAPEKPQPATNQQTPYEQSDEKVRLDTANAINTILSKRVLKKTGGAYDVLEGQVQSFLRDKLSSLFGNPADANFTPSEIAILKGICQRVHNKT